MITKELSKEELKFVRGGLVTKDPQVVVVPLNAFENIMEHSPLGREQDAPVVFIPEKTGF